MRKRFTKAEREAFTPGASVEWRNSSHWHPGTITGPVVTDDGWDGVPLTNHATTRTCHAGQHITGSPTCVRVMPSHGVSEQRRRELVQDSSDRATLDGKRACVAGVLNSFATVFTVPGGVTRAEFAWETVDRIMTRDGKFTT